MNKYWLHRISHEWNMSSSLLKEGYLTIGWACLSNSGIEKKVQIDNFEHIMVEYNLINYRSRWSLWNFCNFRKNDIVVIPLYNGEFSIFRVIDNVYPIKLLSKVIKNKNRKFKFSEDMFLVDSINSRTIDLGFFIPVEPIKENLSRYEYADSALVARMKMRQTNGDISDLAENVENVLSTKSPINLYASVIGNLAKQLLEAIKTQLTPNKFEKLIKWYFVKIGATNAYIDAKNKSNKTNGADADIIAEFEQLKIIFYIQAKLHSDITSEWAVEQIIKYKGQFEIQFGEYIIVPWVISTADVFSDVALELAEKERVRLIAGEEFARMLIDAGITDINKAFE